MNPALLLKRARSAAFMLQISRSQPIQGFILSPATSHTLQDESCAPTHASRSAAFMLQISRPQPIQGFILSPATSHILQDESCAPTQASQERGIYAAESPTEGDPGVNSRSSHLERSAGVNPALLYAHSAG